MKYFYACPGINTAMFPQTSCIFKEFAMFSTSKSLPDFRKQLNIPEFYWLLRIKKLYHFNEHIFDVLTQKVLQIQNKGLKNYTKSLHCIPFIVQPVLYNLAVKDNSFFF